MTKGDDIGAAVANGAKTESQHQCLKYVRRGIQKALGLADQPIGIQSAKDAGPWLIKVGFEEIDTDEYQNGDVIVVDSNGNHPHGHIEVKYGKKWYSDFVQNTPYPWANAKFKGKYRYKQIKDQKTGFGSFGGSYGNK